MRLGRQIDPQLQRLRGKAPASTRQVRDFFLKSRPQLRGPSSGARPSFRHRAVAAPCSGTLPLGRNHSLQLPL